MEAIRPTKMLENDECDSWGYRFRWTGLHQSPEELHSIMHTYDSLADECLQRLKEISTSAKSAPVQDSHPIDNQEGKTPEKDTYALLRDYWDNDPVLKQLWTQINTIPEWVDWNQIERGQDVFYRYGLPILNALNFESLLGGMGANRIVETLARTGGFSATVARRRMLETLQHVIQVTSSLDSIKPGGDGHIASVRVRLLHAAVRQRILALAKQKPEYYNVQEFGVPVNDLDCIATISSFSAVVIWIGLPRQGIWLKDQEIDDYIALWRLVGHYMGSPTHAFRTRESSRAIMESIILSELQPTDTGQVLAKNIILSMENSPPTYSSKEFMEAMARQLNGKQLSDELGIPRPSIYYQALIYGYCVIVSAYAFMFRTFPSLDKKAIAVRRKRYYKLTTGEEGLGKETLFKFKYIPSYSRTTRLGKRKGLKAEKSGLEAVGKIGLFAVVFNVTMLAGMAGSGLLTPLLGALQACISVLLTMCYGAATRRFNLIRRESIHEMSGLGVKAFLPALLIVNLGNNLHSESAMNYVPVLAWSIAYTFCSIGLGIGLTKAFKLPPWVTPACAFNNTTSLPLLLLQSLESVGSLKPIIPKGETASNAIERAQSYFLVCAVVSKTIGYVLGPRLLHGKDEEGDNSSNEQDTEDRHSEQGEQSGEENEEDNIEQNQDEFDETTHLLPRPAQMRLRKAGSRIKRWEQKISSLFPNRVKQDLMAPFESPFADTALACALIGAVLGLVPPLHKAFFNPADQGGIFNGWLTASINNIGRLFTTFQIFVVGCTLGVSFERMGDSQDSGMIPIRAIVTIFLVRLVLWPVLGVSVIYGLAKRTHLVCSDPMLWFSMMMMPQGPPALVISGLSELANVSEQEKMAVAKTLTIMYAISPVISLGLTAALKASEAVLGYRSPSGS